MALALERVTLGYGAAPVVRDVDLALPAGCVTALVGPNASGKSTLLRALSRQQKPRSGRVLIDDTDLSRLPAPQLAKLLALLPQHPSAPADLSVRDLVAFGRFPHRRWSSTASAADQQAIAAAMASVDLEALADRALSTLSGGQRQRAWIAMVLAQETKYLLLDEPTAALDLNHQIEVLSLLRALPAKRGTSVVLALHDLNLAARWADHVVVLANGRVAAAGAPRDVLTTSLLAAVYGIEALVLHDDDVPVFAARGLHQPAPTSP